MLTSDTPCPCGSGHVYQDCCAPFHHQLQIPADPQALMRSRFSAFALNLLPYLRITWHPTTCPDDLTLDDNPDWLALEIVTSGIRKYPRHNEGYVHFRATCKDAQGDTCLLEERSRFVRENGRWLYLDGENSFTKLS